MAGGATIAGMARSVALLRGVNVGGRRRVAMADLRGAFTAAGCRDVETSIQSGNVVFSPPTTPRAPHALEAHLERQLRDDLDLDAAVLVRTADELGDVLAANPHPDAVGTHLAVWFLRDDTAAAPLAAFDAAPFAPEALTVRGRHAYLYLPARQGRSKLAAALGRLRPPVLVTARNLNSVRKLHELATGP